MHDLDKYLFFIAFVSHFLPVKIGDFLGKLVFWCIYPLTPVVAIVGLVLKLMGVVHFTLIEVLVGPFVMMLYGGASGGDRFRLRAVLSRLLRDHVPGLR